MRDFILVVKGEVSEWLIRKVNLTVSETLEKIDLINKPLSVHLFKDRETMLSYILNERIKYGVKSPVLSHDFLALHDAWTGKPRIMVCQENITHKPLKVFIGALRHEIGHASLHGDLKYYLLKVPAPLVSMKQMLKLNEKYIFTLLYLLSIAVKDFEVTSLLVSKEFIDDQLELIIYQLKPEREERNIWSLAQGNIEVMGLFLAYTLKPIFCSLPLYMKTRLIDKCIRKSYSYMSNEMIDRVIDFSIKTTNRFLEGETLKNISITSEAFNSFLLTLSTEVPMRGG